MEEQTRENDDGQLRRTTRDCRGPWRRRHRRTVGGWWLAGAGYTTTTTTPHSTTATATRNDLPRPVPLWTAFEPSDGDQPKPSVTINSFGVRTLYVSRVQGAQSPAETTLCLLVKYSVRSRTFICTVRKWNESVFSTLHIYHMKNDNNSKISLLYGGEYGERSVHDTNIKTYICIWAVITNNLILIYHIYTCITKLLNKSLLCRSKEALFMPHTENK